MLDARTFFTLSPNKKIHWITKIEINVCDKFVSIETYNQASEQTERTRERGQHRVKGITPERAYYYYFGIKTRLLIHSSFYTKNFFYFYIKKYYAHNMLVLMEVKCLRSVYICDGVEQNNCSIWISEAYETGASHWESVGVDVERGIGRGRPLLRLTDGGKKTCNAR